MESVGASPLITDDKSAVSVVICTRNRGSSILATLESVYKTDQPNFELIVVDQSTDGATKAALMPFLADPRFHYIPTQTTGKGFACNIGLTNARADIVVFTDDDCIISSKMLAAFQQIFATYPQVAIIFGSVAASSYDHSKGVNPEVHYNKDHLISSFRPGDLSHLMGAGMAVRKSMVTRWGGFEANIGPGTAFKSGDDLDIAIRSLGKGGCIYLLSEVFVIHNGFRTNQEYRVNGANNFYGIGAIHAKFIKNHDPRILPVILYTIWVKCIWQPVIETLRIGKPQGLFRWFYYEQGLLQGLKTPMDRNNLLYHVSN